MRLTLFFAALLAFDGGPKTTDLQLINNLNDAIQDRFDDPAPERLGMSRIAVPDSFGRHYFPLITNVTDLVHGSPKLGEASKALEAAGLQTGFYVFGRSILSAEQTDDRYRAFKGPAIATAGTVRPCSYPPFRVCEKPEGSLPDWQEMYGLAKRAMKSFADHGKGFETTQGEWQVAVRPVIASAERCVGCHNSPMMRLEAAFITLQAGPVPVGAARTEAGQPAAPSSAVGPYTHVEPNDALGGVIYAYRRKPAPAGGL